MHNAIALYPQPCLAQGGKQPGQLIPQGGHYLHLAKIQLKKLSTSLINTRCFRKHAFHAPTASKLGAPQKLTLIPVLSTGISPFAHHQATGCFKWFSLESVGYMRQ